MFIVVSLLSGTAKTECSVHVFSVKIMQIIFYQGSVREMASGEAPSARGSEKWTPSLLVEEEDELRRRGGI